MSFYQHDQNFGITWFTFADTSPNLFRLPSGPPIRSSRIRTIAGQIANQLKAGTRSLDAVDKLFDRTVGPMRGFSVLLSKLFVAFQAFDTFDTIVNFITRAAFCSWFEGNIEFFETLQGWVQILTDVTKSITGLVASLDGFLGPFNRFKTDVTDAVMNALGVFNGLLSPLIGLADALGFILVLDTFFIPFVIASFSIDKKCWTISFKIFRKSEFFYEGGLTIPWLELTAAAVKHYRDQDSHMHSVASRGVQDSQTDTEDAV